MPSSQCLAKYRKMLFCADVGQLDTAVELCLLTAQPSSQAARDHAWLSREGGERRAMQNRDVTTTIDSIQ